MTKEEMLKQEAEEWLNKWELCNKCDHKVQCIEDNAMCPQVVERAYLASAEPRERQITGLSKHILELQKDKGNLIDRCRELEQHNNWLEGCKSELGEHLGKANDRIAVLEKRCANYEMTISKMEKGTCDICKETEKDKRITELEMTVGTLRTFSNEQATCIEELEKACEETQELLDKQIEATYKLDKENVELKCECRRCVYSDCPCIVSDYGKDKNGICDHFKDVFDENAELKVENAFCEKACEGVTMMYEQLTKAKEIIKIFLKYEICTLNIKDELADNIAKAKAFLKSEVEK